ncbi:MAG: alpha/beta hydrolase [Deltaproteobacteria bacterium]|nr:alpha/beta hydrolase [Deltaproteobacteria bacterium]
MAKPPTFDEWRARGRYAEINGRRVFVVEQGEGPRALVLLHGYPSFSYDFHAAVPRFAEHFVPKHCRVIAHDHLGFGLSDKPSDYSYSLVDQADFALALWRKLGVKSAHILAHDYGTSVATEIVARAGFGIEPVTIESLTLCNGSVHIELADLRVIQRLLADPRTGPMVAKLTNRHIFHQQMRRLWADPAKASDAELGVLWEGLTRDDGRRNLPTISRYIHERRRLWHRWIGGLTRWDRPTHILWAKRDPVAVPAIAEQLLREIPGAVPTWFDDLGHYPMLEDSARWSDAALAFFRNIGAFGGSA